LNTILALDVGTTSVKAGIIEAGGRLVSSSSVDHPLATPAPGWAEQDPENWWSASCDAVAQLDGQLLAGVLAIAVTGQMQDLIAVDEAGHAVRPAILYSDGRATAEHNQLLDSFAEQWVIECGPTDHTNVAAKWRWLQAHEPATIDAAKTVLFGAGAYIVQRLTSRMVCDPTTAVTTGLATRSGTWWSTMVDQIGCPVPTMFPGDSVVGKAGPAATSLGVAVGTPVINACGDAVATTLGVVGVGVERPYVYVGTSGWVAIATRQPHDHEGVIVLPGLDENHWLAVAPMPTAGAAIDWAREVLLGGIDFAAFEHLVTQADPNQSVLFVPHLDGTRLPTAVAEPAGLLMGASRSTTKADIAAAVVEGVASSCDQLVGLVAPRASALRCVGGLSRSPTFQQALADATGRPVLETSDTHAAIIGAAICAARALGVSEPEPGAPQSRVEPVRGEQQRRKRRQLVAEVVPTMKSMLRQVAELASADEQTREKS